MILDPCSVAGCDNPVARITTWATSFVQAPDTTDGIVHHVNLIAKNRDYPHDNKHRLLKQHQLSLKFNVKMVKHLALLLSFLIPTHGHKNVFLLSLTLIHMILKASNMSNTIRMLQ